MSRYIARRLAAGAVVVLAATFVTYAVFQLNPQDPGTVWAGTPQPTPAQVQATDHRLGVDQSLWHQYEHFLRRLAHGSLGTSFGGDSLNQTVASALPVTALLVLGGVLLMLAVALPLAIVSARHAGTWIDRTIFGVSVLGVAFHPFVLTVVLKQIFGTHLHLLPYGGYCPMHHAAPFRLAPGTNLPPSSIASLAASAHGGAGTCRGAPWPWLWFQHMILPWATFALFLLPFYIRILRTRLVESFGDPHVTVARAKGASETRVLLHHILRAVFATTVAMLALDLSVAITAAAYVEVSYNVPGLGFQMVAALRPSGIGAGVTDLPTMAAIVLVVTVAITIFNILADLATHYLDPRTTLDAGART